MRLVIEEHAVTDTDGDLANHMHQIHNIPLVGIRRSTAEEQAWPLVFLNSRRSSYIAGESLHTDAGFRGAMVTGQIS